MAETYCGKSCAECPQKEALTCPGCKAGPGQLYESDCELAQCVRNKGHETCDTCSFHSNCATLRSRSYMPDYRKRKIESEQQQRAAVERRAPILGKWLWILFWLIIPNSISGLMSNQTVTSFLPGLYVPGQILGAIVSAAYGLILIKLSAEEAHYHTAGICALVSGGVSILVALLSGAAETPTWTLIFTLPAVIVSLIGQYHEFTAHGIVLEGVDNKLSDKWAILWKWQIGMLGTMLGSILIMLIIPILGLFVMLISSIGAVAVSIVKLVYLYRTAKLFRDYPVGEN